MKRAYNIIIWGFPVILMLLQYFIKGMTTIDFVGISLASAGISRLISTIKPKPVQLSPTFVVPKNFVVRNTRDELLIALAWLFIFCELLVWVYMCCKMDMDIQHNFPPPTTLLTPLFYCGLANYLLGLTFATIKEKV